MILKVIEKIKKFPLILVLFGLRSNDNIRESNSHRVLKVFVEGQHPPVEASPVDGEFILRMLRPSCLDGKALNKDKIYSDR